MNHLTRSRKKLFSTLILLGLGCGVVEHPHDVQAIDTSNDFGPIGGGAPPVGVAGTPAAVAGGVAVPLGGGGAGSAGTTSVGGMSPVAGAAPTAGTGPAAGAGGAPPSGVTITLGGVNVPKEKAIGFIHVGHSNMAGRATRPSASKPFHFQETHPHAFMYRAGAAPKLALEPTAGTPGFAGPGTALVKEAAVLAPDYYFISLGFGQPSAYCSQFLPGSLYYDQLIAAPKAIKGRITFGAIFIFLGITERHGSEADRTGFPSCINSLVTAIRNDVGEPNLPFMLNDYEVEATGEFSPNGAVATAIRPQIAKVPSVVQNSALVSAEGLSMQDDHHFDLDGHRVWAQRALMTMQQKGWFPWGK
jgi:Carbohydrate esterase, sialic acid-specific acetylesterase